MAKNKTGIALKMALLKKQKTSTWLAEQMGLTPQGVSVIVRTGSTTTDRVTEIASILGYKVSELYALAED
jgi:plasmid maintenance system antidote protein VapI